MERDSDHGDFAQQLAVELVDETLTLSEPTALDSLNLSAAETL